MVMNPSPARDLAEAQETIDELQASLRFSDQNCQRVSNRNRRLMVELIEAKATAAALQENNQLLRGRIARLELSTLPASVEG
ncbi:MAG: small-conductance mechanosensitive channel [Myxococcota bacterium]|jgi:small-conductance mechanosensitive channel